MVFPKQALSWSREVEVPGGRAEWLQSVFVTTCSPFAVVTAGNVLHMAVQAHSSPLPKDKSTSMNHPSPHPPPHVQLWAPLILLGSWARLGMDRRA